VAFDRKLKGAGDGCVVAKRANLRRREEGDDMGD